MVIITVIIEGVPARTEKVLVIKTHVLLGNSKNLEENLDFDQRSLMLFLQGSLLLWTPFS